VSGHVYTADDLAHIARHYRDRIAAIEAGAPLRGGEDRDELLAMVRAELAEVERMSL
jgi:phage terminase Nu1 subunit (DNA packaging protein)